MNKKYKETLNEIDLLTDEDYILLGKALVNKVTFGGWGSSVLALSEDSNKNMVWEICDPGCGCCGGPDVEGFSTLKDLINSLKEEG